MPGADSLGASIGAAAGQYAGSEVGGETGGQVGQAAGAILGSAVQSLASQSGGSRPVSMAGGVPYTPVKTAGGLLVALPNITEANAGQVSPEVHAQYQATLAAMGASPAVLARAAKLATLSKVGRDSVQKPGEGMSTATKVAIGLGVAALLGGGVYLATRKRRRRRR